jgi:iron(III) transport system substrate-binding protein
MKPVFRRFLGIAAATAAPLPRPPPFAQKTELLVYTALETDQLKAYTESFQKTNPNIDLKFVRDSTGVITAKCWRRRPIPQADVIIGVAASSMEIFKQEGMLAPYAPVGFNAINRKFSDSGQSAYWVGMDVFAAVVCYNTGRGAKKNDPKPESWADLAKPVYKGQSTMPNPASSGTGYFDVTAWLQTMGEANGWKYMDALHENIAQYTPLGLEALPPVGRGRVRGRHLRSTSAATT